MRRLAMLAVILALCVPMMGAEKFLGFQAPETFTDICSDVTFWINHEDCTPECTSYTLHATDEHSVVSDTSTRRGTPVINASDYIGNGASQSTAYDDSGDEHWEFTSSCDLADTSNAITTGNNTDQGQMIIWFKLTTEENARIFNIKHDGFRVGIEAENAATSTFTLSMRWGSGNLEHASTLDTGTWYCAIAKWQVYSGGTDYRALSVYNTSTGAEIGTGVSGTTAPDLNCGNTPIVEVGPSDGTTRDGRIGRVIILDDRTIDASDWCKSTSPISYANCSGS